MIVVVFQLLKIVEGIHATWTMQRCSTAFFILIHFNVSNNTSVACVYIVHDSIYVSKGHTVVHASIIFRTIGKRETGKRRGNRRVWMAAAEILFTHNNLHSGLLGQEPTLLAGRMGLASNSDAEEGGPITERLRKKQKGERDPCGFFASGDSVINFLLAVLLPCFSLVRKASCRYIRVRRLGKLLPSIFK